MIPLDIGLAFFASALVLAIAPGPDNIFVLTQSALYGVKAGFATVFGLMSGLVGHTLAVALGVAAIFQTTPLAFTALKILGAGYLMYLAWLTLRSGSAQASLEKGHFPGCWALYKRGIIMNITNPKVTLFCLAFLPQFADPARGSLPGQIIILGLLFMLSTLLIFGGVALLGGQLAAWFNRSPSAQIFLNRLAALVFTGLAAALLFT